MKKNYLLAGLIVLSYTLAAQNVGIGTVSPASKLHIKGTVDTTQLIIDAHSTQSNTNPLIKLRNSSGTDLLWIHSDDATNSFVGLNAGRVNNASGGGTNNTFIGRDAGYSNTTGFSNTANGYQALYSNNTGYRNTANGFDALLLNTTGNFNTANGAYALYLNTTGDNNTANGYGALLNNAAGSNATAIGNGAMYYANNQATPFTNYNVAVGFEALRGSGTASANTGNQNTAIGYQTLLSNTTGFWNTANGYQALYYNTTGYYNTANGFQALYNNNSGYQNTANGVAALLSNTTGFNNTANGYAALSSNTTGSFNTAVGYASGTSSSYNNTVSIGNSTYLNGASNQAFLGGTSTLWNGGNVGWSTFSDERMKRNITEDVKGLDFITRLRPVTYYRSIKAMAEITGNKKADDYPEKYDIEKIKFTGFLAQEVEQAAKEAHYDFSGITIPKNSKELYTLSYEQFVVPLVKGMQEQQQQIESLKKENEILKPALQKLNDLEKRLAILEKK